MSRWYSPERHAEGAVISQANAMYKPFSLAAVKRLFGGWFGTNQCQGHPNQMFESLPLKSASVPVCLMTGYDFQFSISQEPCWMSKSFTARHGDKLAILELRFRVTGFKERLVIFMGTHQSPHIDVMTCPTGMSHSLTKLHDDPAARRHWYIAWEPPTTLDVHAEGAVG